MQEFSSGTEGLLCYRVVANKTKDLEFWMIKIKKEVIMGFYCQLCCPVMAK